MVFSYDCERSSRDSVSLRLRGSVGQEDISTIREELKTIRAEHEGSLNVLLDFTEVEQCDVKTRHELLELHKVLGRGKGRTAYIADRPRIRGIALWVIHHANDGRATVLGRASQAAQWFQRDDERLEQASSQGAKLLQYITGRRRRR